MQFDHHASMVRLKRKLKRIYYEQKKKSAREARGTGTKKKVAAYWLCSIEQRNPKNSEGDKK